MSARACLLVLGLTTALCAQVAVVPSALAAQPLDQSRIRDLFLGRVTSWDDGTPVRVVLVEDGDAQLTPVVGRDHQRLLRGWKRLVYAGNGAMPLVVPNARAAIETLKRHPGAIALLPDLVDDRQLHCVRIEIAPGS